ncbi:hypothetical protein EZV73_24800 [Acidaminobacter sp. JC074]|uniref:hypothetical protein n=1 Tax=Acidaminobacter sp. JC074 TaxID=2530199 RepID=UPI001F114B70|nr:hypothetical protein [Acidaminobacter sp. JC074]MCH4890822.1 hypothetical protein [Acidaminobacter sp. JC074]
MKRLLFVLILLLLVGCQEDESGLITKEIIHYHNIEYINDTYTAGEISYSECKEYKNGLLMKAYTMAPDGSHHNISTYKYKRGLLDTIERIDGINEYFTEYTYAGDQTKSVKVYHNDVEINKTLYEYNEDTVKAIIYINGELYSESIEKTDGNMRYTEIISYPDETKHTLQITLHENGKAEHYLSEDGDETTNVYDDKDNLIRTISTSNGEISEMSISYDEHGNRVSEISPFMTREYEYVYNDKGDYVEKKSYRDGHLTKYITREVTYGK